MTDEAPPFRRRTVLKTVGVSTLLSGAYAGRVGAQTTISVPDDCSSIEDAIDAASAGDTIEVDSGEYNESPLSISNLDNLTLRGAGSDEVTIIRSGGSSNRGLEVDESDGVTLEGFTLKNTDSGVFGLKLQRSDDLHLEDVHAVDNGRTGIDLNKTANPTLVDVAARNNDGAGIALRNLSGATIEGAETNENAWGGLALWAPDGEEVTDTDVMDSSFTDASAPSVFAQYPGTFENVSLTNNVITTVAIDDQFGTVEDVDEISVRLNKIVDGVDNSGGGKTLDASANYWDSTAPSDVEGMVAGAVDFTPLLHGGTETDPGFDPAVDEFTVHTLGEQMGSVGRIQEGVNLAGGSTVTVVEGTYDEDVTVDVEDVSLEGPNAGTCGHAARDSEATIEGQIVLSADGTTLDGLDVSPPPAQSNPEGEAVRISNAPDDVTVQNNVVRDFEEDGLDEWLGIEGIVAFGGHESDPIRNPTISCNEVKQIEGRDEKGGAAGIMVQGNVIGATVEDNNVVYIGKKATAWAQGVVVTDTDNHNEVPEDVEISGNHLNNILANPGTDTFGVGVGIESDGESYSVTGNDIVDNEYGVEVKEAAGETAVNLNNIEGNSEWGGINIDDATLDAECNWWGEDDGPDGEGSGGGDSVSENVDFEPWLVGPIEEDASCTGGAPDVSNVDATPNPVEVDEITELAATIDDSDSGGSAIVSAEYSIDGGEWTDMGPEDGDFEEAIEDVEATLEPFEEPQIITVCVRGTDAEGATSAPECIDVAVYDPDGGFVTGGGWFDSPEGAYKEDEYLTGKATFGFVSKYKKGANEPKGNTQFRFHAADLEFKSDDYEWLVVSGNTARFKGTGSLKGDSDPYKFQVFATDDGPDGDAFRIKIVDEDTDEVVYDNGSKTPIEGGNIKVNEG